MQAQVLCIVRVGSSQQWYSLSFLGSFPVYGTGNILLRDNRLLCLTSLLGGGLLWCTKSEASSLP